MAGVPLEEGLVTRSMELELFASLPVAADCASIATHHTLVTILFAGKGPAGGAVFKVVGGPGPGRRKRRMGPRVPTTPW